MKPWQASKAFLESGAPLDELENELCDFLQEDDRQISISSSAIQKLIHPNIPYTWPDEVAQFDGTIHSQQHRPNTRTLSPAADGNLDLQIIQLDEAIMWEMYQLENSLDRLYLYRDIRNELYYINNSEEETSK